MRLIDILPTIIEYLGYEQELGFQGTSLKGMIDGNDKASRPAYSEATSLGTERESMRANGFKYIYRISYGHLARHVSRGIPLTPLHELYHLDSDPGEKENIAENQQGKLKDYQKRILSIFPERTFEDRDEVNLRTKSIDISKDKELIESLKTLGYIQ